MSFLGKLNVASWGLAIGAGGQTGLYKNLLPGMPTWAILVPLVLPWLTVYTISFCRVPPRPTQAHFPAVAARILTYIGALSFIVLILAYISLRRLDSIDSN